MSYDTLKNTKLIVFDLDGTLADTVPSIARGVNLALAECGYPEREFEYIRRAIGDGPRMLCRRTIPDQLSDDDAAVDAMLAVYHSAYARTHLDVKVPYDGYYEVIPQLRRRGYRLAVLSNKQDSFTAGIISGLFPGGEFETTLGAIPGKPIKPDPSGLYEICRRLGVAPAETAVVGDGDTDIHVAEAAGADSVSVAWGYRSRDALIAAGARRFAERPADLLLFFPDKNR